MASCARTSVSWGPEELTHATSEGTRAFVNRERFEERDAGLIVMVLYSDSHLLSIPKFL